jgi:hypothetical protein
VASLHLQLHHLEYPCTLQDANNNVGMAELLLLPHLKAILNRGAAQRLRQILVLL